MLGNRLRTVTGENVGVVKATSRLAYYFFGTKKWKKMLARLFEKVRGTKTYREWLEDKEQQLSETDCKKMQETLDSFPNIAVLVVGDKQVERTLNSLQNQLYSRFDVYVTATALNNTPNVFTGDELQTYEWILVVNAGDLLYSSALLQFAYVCMQHPQAQVVFAHDDVCGSAQNRYSPQFKPGWSPDLWVEYNYIKRAVLKGTMLKGIRLVHTSGNNIVREALQKKSITREQAVLVNRVLVGADETQLEPEQSNSLGLSDGQQEAKVSIIIPTRNKTDLVKQCIQSILEVSTYNHYEIILVDNRSNESAFFDYVKELEAKKEVGFTCLKADIDFNFSTLINMGVKAASGDFVLLLNNDVQVITPDWMQQMMYKAKQNRVGAVGVKLLYPNHTIQHAGIVLSPERVTEHVFVGKEANERVYQNALNTTRNYLALTAACLMVERKKYWEVDGFDPAFKVEYNDIDFCLKLYESGYDNVYLPTVQLYHYESASRRHPHSDSESYARHLSETAMAQAKWGKYIQHDPFHIFDRINRKTK